MDNELKREIDALDEQLEKEFRYFDEIDKKTDWKKSMETFHESFASDLRGSMGKDIHSVINGEKRVKLSLKMRIKNILSKVFGGERNGDQI